MNSPLLIFDLKLTTLKVTCSDLANDFTDTKWVITDASSIYNKSARKISRFPSFEITEHKKRVQQSSVPRPGYKAESLIPPDANLGRGRWAFEADIIDKNIDLDL